MGHLAVLLNVMRGVFGTNVYGNFSIVDELAKLWVVCWKSLGYGNPATMERLIPNTFQGLYHSTRLLFQAGHKFRIAFIDGQKRMCATVHALSGIIPLKTTYSYNEWLLHSRYPKNLNDFQLTSLDPKDYNNNFRTLVFQFNHLVPSKHHIVFVHMRNSRDYFLCKEVQQYYKLLSQHTDSSVSLTQKRTWRDFAMGLVSDPSIKDYCLPDELNKNVEKYDVNSIYIWVSNLRTRLFELIWNEKSLNNELMQNIDVTVKKGGLTDKFRRLILLKDNYKSKKADERFVLDMLNQKYQNSTGHADWKYYVKWIPKIFHLVVHSIVPVLHNPSHANDFLQMLKLKGHKYIGHVLNSRLTTVPTIRKGFTVDSIFPSVPVTLGRDTTSSIASWFGLPIHTFCDVVLESMRKCHMAKYDTAFKNKSFMKCRFESVFSHQFVKLIDKLGTLSSYNVKLKEHQNLHSLLAKQCFNCDMLCRDHENQMKTTSNLPCAFALFIFLVYRGIIVVSNYDEIFHHLKSNGKINQENHKHNWKKFCTPKFKFVQEDIIVDESEEEQTFEFSDFFYLLFFGIKNPHAVSAGVDSDESEDEYQQKTWYGNPTTYREVLDILDVYASNISSSNMSFILKGEMGRFDVKDTTETMFLGPTDFKKVSEAHKQNPSLFSPGLLESMEETRNDLLRKALWCNANLQVIKRMHAQKKEFNVDEPDVPESVWNPFNLRGKFKIPDPDNEKKTIDQQMNDDDVIVNHATKLGEQMDKEWIPFVFSKLEETEENTFYGQQNIPQAMHFWRLSFQKSTSMPVPDGNPDLTNKVLEKNDERKVWDTWLDLDHLNENEKQVWLEPSVSPMFVVAGQEEHNYLADKKRNDELYEILKDSIKDDGDEEYALYNEMAEIDCSTDEGETKKKGKMLQLMTLLYKKYEHKVLSKKKIEAARKSTSSNSLENSSSDDEAIIKETTPSAQKKKPADKPNTRKRKPSKAPKGKTPRKKQRGKKKDDETLASLAKKDNVNGSDSEDFTNVSEDEI